MCNTNNPKFPCKICAKNVHDKDKAVQCDLCELCIHIKCNNLNYLDYIYLQNCDESWYCIDCCSTVFLFNSLSSNKNFFSCCTNTDSITHTHCGKHQILLAKLNHYGIRGVSNDWFKSYLSNRSQYVSINGYGSGLVALNCPSRICVRTTSVFTIYK